MRLLLVKASESIEHRVSELASSVVEFGFVTEDRADGFSAWPRFVEEGHTVVDVLE